MILWYYLNEEAAPPVSNVVTPNERKAKASQLEGNISFTQAMDPGDILDFEIDCSVLVGTDSLASYVIETPAESELYGLQLGINEFTHRKDENLIKFWLHMTEDPKTSLTLPVQITITTTSIPPRTLQRSFGVRVTQL